MRGVIGHLVALVRTGCTIARGDEGDPPALHALFDDGAVLRPLP